MSPISGNVRTPPKLYRWPAARCSSRSKPIRKHKKSVRRILRPSGGNSCRSLSVTESVRRPFRHRETIGNWKQTQCRTTNGGKCNLGGRVRQGQPHLKQRVAGRRGDLNSAAVLFHDALDGVEAEAGSLAYSLGREEGLKDVRLHIGR